MVICFEHIINKASLNTVLIQSLTWTLVSDHTSFEVQYRVVCVTQYAAPEQVQWTKNGVTVVNNATQTLSHQLVTDSYETFNNILTVTREEHQNQKITCAVLNNGSVVATHSPVNIDGQ